MRRAGLAAADVLHQEGHAAEWPVGQRSRGDRAGPLERRMDDGVQPRVQALEARDGVVDKLARRDVAATHERGLGGGVEGGEIVGHATRSSTDRIRRG